MTDFARLAEQRLREAIARGELDRLPGRGEPLALDDSAAVPAELRTAYRILRQHGLVPREVELLRRIDAARLRVEAASDPAVRAHELRQLEELCLEYNEIHRRPVPQEMSALKPRDRR
ncbi:MAG: DUF1992 domain-containing protein [Deltaproteobacteria bacterium]|nr:DUF1992 domain-containing protein [Deltaproteobacteria bacterium]